MDIKKQVASWWIEFMWMRREFNGGFCEHNNETWGLIKGGYFLYQLREHQILNKFACGFN
jgi:hypothetical protein